MPTSVKAFRVAAGQTKITLFNKVFLSVNDINAASQSVKCFIFGDIAAHLTSVNRVYIDILPSSLHIKIFDVGCLVLRHDILHELGILSRVRRLMERLCLCVLFPSAEQVVREESVLQIVLIRIVEVILEVLASSFRVVIECSEAVFELCVRHGVDICAQQNVVEPALNPLSVSLSYGNGK